MLKINNFNVFFFFFFLSHEKLKEINIYTFTFTIRSYNEVFKIIFTIYYILYRNI
jgi:hypothetical protein